MRRLESASLLTFEVPSLCLEGGRYSTGRPGAAVTRSKKARTYYVEAHVVGDIENYVDSSRAAAIRTGQAQGRYDGLMDRILAGAPEHSNGALTIVVGGATPGRRRRVSPWPLAS